MSRPVLHSVEKTGGEEKLPRHVAIIMDGNGRWAKARHLPRVAGHKKGATALQKTIEACIKAGIPYLTLYAFSSENWQRPPGEVDDLMNLLRGYLESELEKLHQEGIRLQIIGNLDRLEQDIRTRLQHALDLTSGNSRLTLTVALSYGGREEIVQAAQALAQQVQQRVLQPGHIEETALRQALYAPALPDPDLLIRTGGEQRISNFLLWQSAYTELYFTPTLWPDFSAKDFRKALEDYGQRERRYGRTNG